MTHHFFDPAHFLGAADGLPDALLGCMRKMALLWMFLGMFLLGACGGYAGLGEQSDTAASVDNGYVPNPPPVAAVDTSWVDQQRADDQRRAVEFQQAQDTMQQFVDQQQQLQQQMQQAVP